MTMKLYQTLAIFLAAAAICACDNMDTLYRDYRTERNYSGKISDLTATAGNARVLLKWTNPQDQISKKIRVRYGISENDIQEKVVESLVDELSVDGLIDATYGFEVCTLTESGDASVPVTITKAPFSGRLIKAITPPVVSAAAKTDTTADLTFRGISATLNLFAGTFRFTCKGSDGSSFQGEWIKDVTKDVSRLWIPNSEANRTFGDQPMVKGVTYKVSYSYNCYPGIFRDIYYDKGTKTNRLRFQSLSLDTMDITGEAEVTVK